VSSIPATEVAARPRRRLVVPTAISLARVEGRRLLRHPMTIVGALGSLAIPVAATWNDVPVLNHMDSHTNEALIPFATAILVAAQLGTMRARRSQTTELFESAPAGEGSRVAGHLLSVLYGAAAALVLVLVQLTYMKIIGGVTMPRPHVVLIGPALVAFSGALGVAVGRWFPRLFAAPVALAGLVAACTAVTTNSWVHQREWLSLWVPSEYLNGVASEVTLRPYGWRLVYLVGLAFIAAGVAVAHLPRLRVAAGLAIAMAVGVTGIAAARQMDMVPRAEQKAMAVAFVERFEDPTCETRRGVAYCPMPGYEDWVARWQAPVEGVLDSVPDGQRVTDIRFLQAPSGADTYDEQINGTLVRKLQRLMSKGALALESDIHPSLSWGRNAREGQSELAVGLEVASRAVGIDSRFRLTKADIAEMPKRYRRQFQPMIQRSCSALEQGRAIVAMWLAAQSTDGARDAFDSAVGTNEYTLQMENSDEMFMDPQQWTLNSYSWDTLGNATVSWGTRESTYASELLKRDRDEVEAVLVQHWDKLTHPETTSEEAATLFGLTPIPTLEETMAGWKIGGGYQGIEFFGQAACR
jgi:hypothetical protein